MKETSSKARTHNAAPGTTNPDIAATTTTTPLDSAQRIAVHDAANAAFDRVSGQIAIIKALIDVAADGNSWAALGERLTDVEFSAGLMALFERVSVDIEVVRAEFVRLWDFEYVHSVKDGAR